MIDFLKYRGLCAILSLALVGSFVVGYAWRGGFAYSVDFTGGSQIKLRFDQPTTSEALRDALMQSSIRHWEGIQIVEFSPTEFRVRVKNKEADMQAMAASLQESIAQKLPDNKSEILSLDSVGSSVGEELTRNSMYAILLGLLIMLLYIAVRFQFAYGMGALISLAHDAIAIGAFFALTGREVSIDVIAAILAILGYSVNDTIVIFARIRENIGRMPGKSLYDIVNISINQTLRRTILTSSATALVVLALLILGGEALRDLSIALLLGIVYGTYSSIYIASPVMMFFSRNKKVA